MREGNGERLKTFVKLKLCISPLYKITPSLLKLCFLNARSLHRHIDVRKDLNYSSVHVNIFAEIRFSSQDDNELHDIAGYALFRDNNPNSNNVSTPYGGTTVYRRIPYLPRYSYCHNIRSIEVTVIKITIHEDWTILGIYRSPKVPVGKLCQAISEVYETAI